MEKDARPSEGRPLWEPGLRIRLATLCMAATAGKPGDMKVATENIIEFCRTLSGVDT